MTVRLLHLADIHLGAKPYGFREREEDIIESFNQAIGYVFEERPDIVIIAGDLFDKPKPENYILKHAVRKIKDVVSRGIPVVAAHGDHDIPGRKGTTILQVLSSAIDGFHAPLPPEGSSASGIVDSQVLKVKGVNILVYPFVKVDLERRREIAKHLLPLFSRRTATMDKPRVFIGHFSLDEVFPLDSVASVSDLPPVEYSALGHVHFRHSSVGERVYAYTGILDPLNVAEARGSNVRGPILVDIDSGGVSLQDLPVDTRPQVEVEVVIERPEHVQARLKTAIADAARKAGDKRPLVYLKAKISPAIPLRLLFNEATRIANTMGVLVKPVHERVVEGKDRVVVASERVNPLDILTGDLRVPEPAARLILEIVEALLEDDRGSGEARAIELLERLSQYEGVLGRWAR